MRPQRSTERESLSGQDRSRIRCCPVDDGGVCGDLRSGRRAGDEDAAAGEARYAEVVSEIDLDEAEGTNRDKVIRRSRAVGQEDLEGDDGLGLLQVHEDDVRSEAIVLSDSGQGHRLGAHRFGGARAGTHWP